MKKGDKFWIVENGRKISEVEVLSLTGNLVLLRTQGGKALRLPKHRLYESQEKAAAAIPNEQFIQRKKTQYDYME